MVEYICDCGRVFKDPDGPIMCADANHGQPKITHFNENNFMFFTCSKCNKPVDQPQCLSVIPKIKNKEDIVYQRHCTLSTNGAEWVQVDYVEALVLLGAVDG